ncbi:MAG: phosphoribosyltransferase family protein [Candidatus Calescibacterium sp.]|nr:phosphoribosyltransferase family protein [Candidatus Calescibacterium sp.]MCX7734802.1 phosphoribosyltransferase family protein [bacterium]MDW8087393.1 phosphoribosyltransferase family protein [Candidatus Calescibacterium sp.]
MRLLFKKDLIESFVQRCAELIQDVAEEKVAIVGVKSGGFFLAKRIHSFLEGKGKDILIGALDITFWRDDISRNPYPIVRGTEINFSIDDIPLFLVDDVIYTGRTTRAALCEIFDYGRPTYVKFFSLVNRVGREIPIHPDFFSFHIKLSENELLEVILREKGFSFDCGVAVERGEKISDEDLQKLLNVS